MTHAAAEFVTPLSVSALTGNKLYRDLFDLTDEAEMGHIQLSRSADIVLVAPATADLMAKMAQGLANDLAIDPVAGHRYARDDRPRHECAHVGAPRDPGATSRHCAATGCDLSAPMTGDMACGEFGPGRMAEPLEIVAALEAQLADGPLKGKHVLVTSGPTHEPIDPVRYIANRSSGAQGTALATALAALGAQVTFVTGPADVPPPGGVTVVPVQTAQQMLEAVQAALPADAAIFAAAVADWRVEGASARKLKKSKDGLPTLNFAENPDILATVAQMEKGRPDLVVGFAAETNDVIANATAKRKRKGCDWIVANDVSPETGIMGGSENAVHLISDDGVEDWPRMPKDQVAARLAARLAQALS